MTSSEIYSATGMMELINKVGFLPLLDSGISGFSADAVVADDCGYMTFPEGGWDWPMWKWKGQIVTEMPCMYGKEACSCIRTPEESFKRMYDHLRSILLYATDKQILKLIG